MYVIVEHLFPSQPPPTLFCKIVYRSVDSSGAQLDVLRTKQPQLWTALFLVA